MKKWRKLISANLAALALAAASTGAHATTAGYFVLGSGAREQSLAGAGSANPTDALTIADNPAGLVFVGRQFNGDISLFSPTRGYDAYGTYLTAPGSVSSYRNEFVLPALGYSQPLNGDSSIGFGMVANGGMDTNYNSGVWNPSCAYFHLPQQGVFCNGRAGVDLIQALIYAGYAQRFGNLSVGIAPVLGIQSFAAYGLNTFAAFGLSSDPLNVSNHSPSYAVGGGVRAGLLYQFSPALSVAVQGSTPIWSTNFKDYTGLFAGGGQFDIPGSIGAGVSYKVLPTLAVMVDWKHIFYSGVPAINNQMAPIYPGSLGTSNGPGFGWKDVDSIAVGFEWNYTDHLTLRAGYAYNTQPITSANVMLNIVAPGVVTSHITGGFTYTVNHNNAIDFAVMYAPRVYVSGQEYLPGLGYNPYSNISIYLEELQVTLGYTYHWDQPAAVVAKY